VLLWRRRSLGIPDLLVQPIVAKSILPCSAAVPAVCRCAACYQTTLFAGYAYAHLLDRGGDADSAPPSTAAVVPGGVTLPVLPAMRGSPRAPEIRAH